MSKAGAKDKILPTCSFLSVTDATASYHPLTDKFADMCEQIQVPVSRSPVMEGHSAGPYFINTRHGTRCSSAVAFLHPATNRPNLTVLTKITAQRIGFHGRRATNVGCLHHGREMTFNAGREVLLAAGAINSPTVVAIVRGGPQDVIRDAGLEVVLDQPNVGSHMQDHLELTIL